MYVHIQLLVPMYLCMNINVHMTMNLEIFNLYNAFMHDNQGWSWYRLLVYIDLSMYVDVTKLHM